MNQRVDIEDGNVPTKPTESYSIEAEEVENELHCEKGDSESEPRGADRVAVEQRIAWILDKEEAETDSVEEDRGYEAADSSHSQVLVISDTVRKAQWHEHAEELEVEDCQNRGRDSRNGVEEEQIHVWYRLHAVNCYTYQRCKGWND